MGYPHAYLPSERGHPREKIPKFFLEMTPLGVKTCGEFEFDIFEAKNEKSQKFAKSPKNCIFATFRLKYAGLP
jgi:hypothetical protein